MDLRFKTPFRMLICGPTGSGKTHWVLNFLDHMSVLMDRRPNRVLFHYRVWQPGYDEMKKETSMPIEFKEGMPSAEDVERLGIYRKKGGVLLIMDDQLDKVSQDTSNIFLVTSRHSGVSVIFLSQNMFPKNPHFKDISRNVSYLVVFKNTRDQRSFATLAQQMTPKGSKYLQDIYKQVTVSPHTYLLMDFDQNTPENVRIRSAILPHEHPMHAFSQKN